MSERKQRLRLLTGPPSRLPQLREEKVEVVESGGQEFPWFRGPLGIWPWPLVNLILAIIYSIRSRAAPTAAPRKPTKKIYSIIRDKEGRIVEIVELEA
ncbi:MAG: hypothetical protein DRP11_03630 [Candidatus Aenigmatarchaeota archaeon]|nr:MAG: hypothetical protein DRP11_03630 [Candidatus Aenigmarchaeota archaeon]